MIYHRDKRLRSLSSGSVAVPDIDLPYLQYHTRYHCTHHMVTALASYPYYFWMPIERD
jgi:hypothetical protein